MSTKSFFISVLPLLCVFCTAALNSSFEIKEASIDDIRHAFKHNQLTSRELVEFYIKQIQKLNPLLRGVVEVNPDAVYQAEKADQERAVKKPGSLNALHGIPILLKDNIATKDKLNTTAGSFALLGSVVPRDSGIVVRLRRAGAVILGKASMTEWAAFRSDNVPSGFCGRSGQGKNPYVLSEIPCGSSSGSAISAAANMAAVTLGTETDGSILCPSSYNSVVGIKPTLGLTSRDLVIPGTPRQDTVGPICRTVSDAVYVLDVITGFDRNDQATKAAAKYIPRGGYKKFLKPDGLRGKRLGILRDLFFNFNNDGDEGLVSNRTFEHHFQTLRQKGAVIVDHLEIENNNLMSKAFSGELYAMLVELKPAINSYLKQLVASPVRSLAAIIAFNRKNPELEKTKEYGQENFENAESLQVNISQYKKALLNMKEFSRKGMEKLMKMNKLDAFVTPGSFVSSFLAIGGFPGISVPAGFSNNGVPFGICFSGLKGSEPILIEISYGFEQATKIRKPPSFKH